MRNVAVTLTTTAWLLGSATEARALAIADLVSRTGQARIAFETREGAKLSDSTPERETMILDAWRKWYGEAVESVHRVLVGTPSAAFNTKVDALAAPFTGK
jgi:hypothetical protein